MGGLNPLGLFWALISAIATILIIGGVLTPEWLIGEVSADGKTLKAFFGSYKRCNYPVLDKESNRIALAAACGRYESFTAVPSYYWKLAILCAASGSSLSLLLCLLLLPSMCIQDIVSSSTALVVGCFQIIASIFLSAALVLYPLGWDNPEVKDACGETADRFALGRCELGRSFISMVVGTSMLIFCSLLSICGGKKRELRLDLHSDGMLIQGFDNTRLDFAK